MNLPDLTQLVLQSFLWLLVGLGIYYVLSFMKVHLLWKIQSRIWNNPNLKNIFSDYYPHLGRSLVTDFNLHLATLKYLFLSKKKDFPLEDSDKTKSIKNRVTVLNSLTLFLKPFLFFGFIFALLRYWIAKQFFYNELQITLGEIQNLLNQLNDLPLVKIINNNKILFYILLGLLLIYIPYLYTKKELSTTIKRRTKLVLVSIAILTNISFFGVLTSESTTKKTNDLLALKLEIETIHNSIFRDTYVYIVDQEIGDELLKEEQAYTNELERFNNKIESVSNFPKDKHLREELNDELKSKLDDIKKASFFIRYLDYTPVDTEYSKKRQSEYKDYHEKNHKNNSSYKNYDDYMANDKKWTKSKGKSIYDAVKSVTQSHKEANGKLRKFLELIFDQGTNVLTSTVLNELDFTSQKTLKKIVNITISEKFKTPVVQKMIDVLNALPNNIAKAKAIFSTKNNLYTFSEKTFKSFKSSNTAFFNTNYTKAKNRQKIIDKELAISNLNEELKSAVSNALNTYGSIFESQYDKTKYVNSIVDSFKKEAKLNQLNTSQINKIVASTAAITNKVRLLIQTSSFRYHPFPKKGCPICAYNNIAHTINKMKL